MPSIDDFVLIVEGFGFFDIILVRVMPAADLSGGLKKIPIMFFLLSIGKGGGRLRDKKEVKGLFWIHITLLSIILSN